MSAKDLGTGHEQSITITSSSNLSEEEIEKAKWEAQMYEKQDEMRGEFLNIRNEAESLIATAESKLSEHKKDWDRATKKQVKEELNALKRVVAKTPPEKLDEESAGNIKSALDKLKNTLADK